MPLFISSFKIWLVTILIVVLSAVAWNRYWSTYNIAFGVKDSKELWAFHRRRIYNSKNDAVVLIGSSRMQLGFDLESFREKTGIKPIQLAITGETPLPVLQDLAQDLEFAGTVISEFSEFILYNQQLFGGGVATHNVKQWIAASKNSKTAADLELRLSGYLRNLVTVPPIGNTLVETVYNILSTRAFERATVIQGLMKIHHLKFDRSLLTDFYSLTENEIQSLRNGVFHAMKNQPTPDLKKFIEIIEEIENSVDRIEARGGKVVFVNFPISSELWQLNQQFFPREEYWNKFVAKTKAKTIHFKDYPKLSAINPYDWSHIDIKDSAAFTEELVKIISNH